MKEKAGAEVQQTNGKTWKKYLGVRVGSRHILYIYLKNKSTL